MNSIRLSLALIAASALFPLPSALAQQTAPPNPRSFFQSFTGYFTSFNTNYDATFGAERATIWTGVDSIQGGAVPLANSLGISYDLYSAGVNTKTLFKGTAVSVENVIRNSGVAGTIVSDQLGFGLSFVVHDVKLTAYADVGYDLQQRGRDKIFGEIGLRVMKALSEHTFAGIGQGAQLPANRQVFSVIAGFTF
jgi:hypothetical protein